jgi:lipid-binding SYLF domain-containing protein
LQKTGGQVVESRVPEVRIPQPGADSTLPPPAASDDKRLEQLKQSGEALKEMMDLPEGLPQEVLDKAVCVMVVPSSGKPKMRERLGARTAPTGPLSCRSGHDFTGPWSAPSIFRLDGQGGPPRSSGYPATDIVNLLLVMFAPEAAPDLILLVMSPQGAETILKGQVRLGAHVTAGRGPKRGTANLALPQVLGYVRTSDGLFIGSSPERLILGQDEAANKGLYGREISAWDIVRGGAVPLPAAGQDLIDTLSRHTREAALQSVAGEISNSQAAPAEAPRPDAVAPPPSRSVLSGDETGIPPGSKVYIYPMGGFESYLIAAIRKKKLPLVVAIEPDGVDFEISGSTTLHGQSAATGALGKIGSISAAASGEEAGDFPRKWEVNVKVRNVHTGAVILDRSVTKRSTARALPHYQQSAAQECADQLKKQIREPGPH